MPTRGRAYDLSKLATVLFTYVARRLSHTSVTANALHPGVVSPSESTTPLACTAAPRHPDHAAIHECAAQGAATSTHAASSQALERMTGQYFTNRKAKRSSKAGYDLVTAASLWRVSSSDLIGLAREA